MTEKFKIKSVEGKDYIFDIIRKKYVFLTPEEWVRQQFLDYLIYTKKYPPSLISVEKSLKIGTLSKRFDILIYKNTVPWMLVECKRENIDLDDHTLRQILAYNSTLKVSYLCICNGQSFHCYNVANQQWQDVLPEF